MAWLPPDELVLPTYAEAAELDHFKINAGDKQGVLTGTRLDEVNGFELKGIRFVPTKLSRADKKDELQLAVDGRRIDRWLLFRPMKNWLRTLI